MFERSASVRSCKQMYQKVFLSVRNHNCVALGGSTVEEPEARRKRRKKAQVIMLSEQETESQTLAELVAVLEELEKEGMLVEVQVCPRCKSPKVRRVKTISGDLWGNMGILPAKFECKECGWRARLILKATNKRLSVRDVEMVAEALELEKQRK